jgi:UDP-N-acetylmuramoyl-tripeptide--D-alanyl-D-alanine ligase
MHLLESQLGEKAKFSHHANSSYGIPFDILGLHRKTLQKAEWIGLFLKTPLCLFTPLPREKLYIVEADCDRPGEGKFLAEFLRPEIVLWGSVAHTHTLQFDYVVDEKKFPTVDEAVAYEFGYFLEYCQQLAVVNGDQKLIVQQLPRTKAKVQILRKSELLRRYSLTRESTEFVIEKTNYAFPALLPEEMFYGIAMSALLLQYLALPFDPSFSRFHLPPGRSSLFAGIKDTVIVDSCYNANLASMQAILAMYAQYPAKRKWAVIGDMLEQGKDEQTEHEKLAGVLVEMELERIIFLGPRVEKYTLPSLREKRSNLVAVEKTVGIASRPMADRNDVTLVAFENPKDVLEYLEREITGGEAILFKGARFMEGVIAHLLKNKSDVSKLSRREKIWDIRRKQWGL